MKSNEIRSAVNGQRDRERGRREGERYGGEKKRVIRRESEIEVHPNDSVPTSVVYRRDYIAYYPIERHSAFHNRGPGKEARGYVACFWGSSEYREQKKSINFRLRENLRRRSPESVAPTKWKLDDVPARLSLTLFHEDRKKDALCVPPFFAN